MVVRGLLGRRHSCQLRVGNVGYKVLGKLGWWVLWLAGEERSQRRKGGEVSEAAASSGLSKLDTVDAWAWGDAAYVQLRKMTTILQGWDEERGEVVQLIAELVDIESDGRELAQKLGADS